MGESRSLITYDLRYELKKGQDLDRQMMRRYGMRKDTEVRVRGTGI